MRDYRGPLVAYFAFCLILFAADRNASAKSSIGQPTDDGVINIKLPQILFNS